MASRVAAKQTRSEEIEKLLYANARGQVEDRLKRNLGTHARLAWAREPLNVLNPRTLTGLTAESKRFSVLRW